MLEPRIGLFGGTFDPVHNGHVNTAYHAAEQLALDMVFWIPCKIPPHKARPNTSEQHRIEMLTLALAGSNHEISDCELSQQRTSYSIHTIELFAKRYPSSKLYFFMGMDSLLSFQSWHRWQDILSLCNLVVTSRPGSDVTELPPTLAKKITENHSLSDDNGKKNGVIYCFDNQHFDISSSILREKLENKQEIEEQLPQSVYNYIMSNQLYC